MIGLCLPHWTVNSLKVTSCHIIVVCQAMSNTVSLTHGPCSKVTDGSSLACFAECDETGTLSVALGSEEAGKGKGALARGSWESGYMVMKSTEEVGRREFGPQLIFLQCELERGFLFVRYGLCST